ncbi:NAD-dependent epimerase/dehydratase family protein [Streptomyces sp. ISL-94]|uniref:NAD-dependent epimerase/dehydratase family protein n=1 Tax=Streptomyces sp. ISL-94 TaxID=2819190 RepID=UPI001BE66CB6|nr:NAD-dependent epimerase/dehydratase family protein [Streptomyces sp. ISL-94]MBT2480623.1 NAD-dependent epimerase/dehydratase family protein [Streptomyces sp. ISL-94]
MRKILVIGGSRYFGKSLVTRARDAGDSVTVLNRGSTAPPAGVGHLVADRDDEDRLRAALGPRTFDAVIDQICYTPDQAAVARRVFAGRTGRYVMTSTMEVYDPATLPGPADPRRREPVAEESLDPVALAHPPGLPWPDRAEAERLLGPARAYAEGKRQAEAVFLREPAFPYVSVRTAHVLGGGPEDFTGRLAHYVGRIADGIPVDVHEAPYATSFIHHEEIAELLHWAAGQSFTGPLNAASHGALDVTALCEAVAERLGRRPVYRIAGEGAAASPFSFDRGYALDNGRAARLGFCFGRIADWLPGAITEVAQVA